MTMLSDGVRAPLIADLQAKFKLQCTVDGRKGVLFKQEILPPTNHHNAFKLNSGFVPFRKTKVSNAQAQRPLKPWESFGPNRPHSWNGWNSSNKTTMDARDAIYLYTRKNKKDNSDSDLTNGLPVIYQSTPRPSTVAKSQLFDLPNHDSHGYRRSYTAVQNSRADQVRARKAVMKKQYLRLNNDKGSFFAVRQVFPSTSAEKNGRCNPAKEQNVAVRSPKIQPRLPIRIDRPMKNEKGRYRPISRTAVRTPKQELEISTPRDDKDPQSAEAYKVILHEKRERVRHERKRNASQTTYLAQFKRTNNTMASYYDDTENRLLQSVIEVNKPPPRADSTQTPPTTAVGTRDGRSPMAKTSEDNESRTGTKEL